MPKPYKNDVEKKAFLEKYREFYKAWGYDPDDMINTMMKTEIISDEGLEHFKRVQDLLHQGYGDPADARAYPGIMSMKYDVYDESVDTNFYRVVKAMYKPEVSIENVRYNEMLAKKLQTEEGCFQVVQDAIALLGQTKPGTWEKVYTDEAVFMDNYNAITVGFVVTDLITALKKFKNNPYFEDRIPSEVVDFMGKNAHYYQDLYAIASMPGLYDQELQYVFPPNERAEKLGEALSSTPKEEKELRKKLQILMGLRDEPEGVYTPAEGEAAKVCEEYFKKIQERMDEERKDYSAAANEAEKLGGDGVFVKSGAGFKQLAAVPIEPGEEDPKRSATLKTIRTRKAHNRALTERTKKLVLIAKENYGKSDLDAAGEIEKLLKDRKLFNDKNQNYLAMISSIERIQNLYKDSENTPEKQEKLVEELKKLEDAANTYLTKKYEDKRSFSSRALKRIDAARLASAFVRGRMANIKMKEVDRILEGNKEIIKNLPARYEAKTNTSNEKAPTASENARNEYLKNPGTETFAKLMIYTTFAKTPEQADALSKEQMDAMIKANTTVAEDLCKHNQVFASLVANGDHKAAKVHFVKALDQYIENNKAADQDPKPESVQKEKSEEQIAQKNDGSPVM